MLISKKSAALLAAIKEYDANKWKVIGQKVGKPAKVRPHPFPLAERPASSLVLTGAPGMRAIRKGKLWGQVLTRPSAITIAPVFPQSARWARSVAAIPAFSYCISVEPCLRRAAVGIRLSWSMSLDVVSRERRVRGFVLPLMFTMLGCFG